MKKYNLSSEVIFSGEKELQLNEAGKMKKRTIVGLRPSVPENLCGDVLRFETGAPFRLHPIYFVMDYTYVVNFSDKTA